MQQDHGDVALGPSGVGAVGRIVGLQLRPQPPAFGRARELGAYLEVLASDLDGGPRIRAQVVTPGRIVVLAAVAGDDHPAVVGVWVVEQRRRAERAASSTVRREQEHWLAGESMADPPVAAAVDGEVEASDPVPMAHGRYATRSSSIADEFEWSIS